MKISGSSLLWLLSTASLTAANNILQAREPLNAGIPVVGSVIGDATSVVVGGINTVTSDVVSFVTTVVEPEFTTLTSDVSAPPRKT